MPPSALRHSGARFLYVRFVHALFFLPALDDVHLLICFFQQIVESVILIDYLDDAAYAGRKRIGLLGQGVYVVQALLDA